MWIHVSRDSDDCGMPKRFALPSMVQSYQYVWLLDDDSELLFDPLHYQCVVKSLDIPLSAPGRLAGALSHDITRVNDGYKAQMGRWTDFVETGPLAVASSAAWQCIFQYLDPSTGSGWGLDSVWCRMLAGLCFPEADRFKVCGIVDAFRCETISLPLSIQVSMACPNCRCTRSTTRTGRRQIISTVRSPSTIH